MRFGVWGERDGGFPSVWPVVASATLAADSSGCVGWTSCHHHSLCVLAAKWGFHSSRTPFGPIAWQTLNFLTDAQIMAGSLSCPCALTLTSGHHDQLQEPVVFAASTLNCGASPFGSWKHWWIMKGCSCSSPLMPEDRLYVTSEDITPWSRAHKALRSYLWSQVAEVRVRRWKLIWFAVLSCNIY